MAGAAQPRRVGRGGGRHCDQCYVEPAPLGRLQGKRAEAPKVSGPPIGTGPQPSEVSPAPDWQKSHLLYPTSSSRPPFVPQAQFAPATYLLEASSPVHWHGPEDCELNDKDGLRSGTWYTKEAEGWECWVGWAVGLPNHPRSLDQAQNRDGARRPTRL